MRSFAFRFIWALILMPSLFAQLSPGPLAESHAHLSGFTKCLTCHTWGSQDLSPNCLNCHAPIRHRIETKRGFHGQLEDENCLVCHRDHLDRDFEMIHWEPSQKEFDHSLTGYRLEGKHIGLDCRQCHKADFVRDKVVLEYAQDQNSHDALNSTFLGLSQTCAECHVDVHVGEFSPQVCEDCHTTNSWQDARETYKHDQRTDFPLKGAHKKISCEKCHKEQLDPVETFQAQRFTGLKFELCTDCHADEHKGSFGNNCLKCHTVRTFKIEDMTSAFNHNKTRFPLIGKHVSVDCNTCHTSEDRFKEIASYDACSDCHEDYHKTTFRPSERNSSCDGCHNVRGFFPSLFGVIEHNKTRFPLDGAHLAQPCIFCHLEAGEPIYQWQSRECAVCHDNAHGGQFSRYQTNGKWCENCHKTTEWADLIFDHSTTFFPLTGKHSALSCGACHKAQGKMIVYENTNLNCADCHLEVHSKQFADKACEDCHGTATWSIANFQHGSLTEFPLDGQHENLSCGQCHKFEAAIDNIRFRPIPHTCQDCHSFGDFKQ